MIKTSFSSAQLPSVLSRFCQKAGLFILLTMKGTRDDHPSTSFPLQNLLSLYDLGNSSMHIDHQTARLEVQRFSPLLNHITACALGPI